MKCRNLVSLSFAGVAPVLALVAMAAVLSSPVLHAEDAASAARAVRLSSVDGKVKISQGDQVLAEPALANTPLFEGTQVATSDDGRAEIQFEDGSLVRISPGSALTLTLLRQQGGSAEAEIVVQSGLVYFELQGDSQAGQLRVKFGDSVVTADGFSVLRINLDNPPGELAVFSGNAHLVRGSALALDLHGGESVALYGAGPSRYNLAESVEPNSWDAWNSDRDQAMTTEAAARTDATTSLGNNNPAWSDLDVNGNWYNVPGQGYIWSPYEAASTGWDPYGNGHWMWTPRFGYIWISGYRWGYTTYQCGAWNYYDSFGWGWAPGMGGCQPWWGSGSYGYNIGYAPSWYSRPAPPLRRAPIGRLPGGARDGRGPHPVIAVDRRPPGATAGLQSRDKMSPVVIGGHRVEPLRSLSPRPVYDRSNSGINSGSSAVFSNHPQPVSRGTGTIIMPSRPVYSTFGGNGMGNSTAPRANPGVARPGYVPAPGVNPGGGQRTPAPSHTYSGAVPSSSHSFGGNAPAPSRPSGGGAPAPSHSSGGGGAPAPNHSSGGGGGGSHSSGSGPHH